MHIETLLLTFLPSLLILAIIIASDKFPEPPKLVFATFFLGFLLCLPAGELNYYFIDGRDNEDALTFIAGITEESLKFLAFFLFVWDRVEFDEPMDAIVYGTCISLGFATFENYEYVYFYNEDLTPFSVALIRSMSAVPLHACCGIIMGYYLGRFKFLRDRRLLFASLAAPIFVHSLYNFLTDYGLLWIIFLAGVMVFTFRQFNNARKRQRLENLSERT